jgi:protein-S-isoprenylcysteine O-methyltransferase Ste14
MTITSHIAPAGKNQHKMLMGILTRAAEVLVVLLIQAAILLLVSWRFDWLWAWVFLGIYLVTIGINSSFMLRRAPETVAERGSAPLTRRWDQVVSSIWALAQYLLIPGVAALDLRFGWTASFAPGWNIAGAVLFAAGLALFSWAMITNAYFSTAVRIQNDRGHTVCKSGPYRIVRHPGYLGAVLQGLGMPLLLGSWWAFIPGVIAAGSMIARTMLEDRTLQAELPGYSEFTREVKYRLIPGIW